MSKFFLNLGSYHFVLLFILFLMLIGLVYLTYRKANPPIPSRLHILLITLRTTVLLLLAFLVFQPLFGYRFENTRNTSIAVLLDSSLSMLLPSNTESDSSPLNQNTRWNRLQDFVEKSILENKPENVTYDVFTFGDRLKRIQDGESLGSTGRNLSGITDLSRAFEELEKEKAGYDAVLIVSDGGINSGGDPASISRKLPIPIHTVAIGKPTTLPDLVLAHVVTDERVYEDKEIPFRVSVKGDDYNVRDFKLDIYQDDKLIQNKSMQLNERNSLQDFNFSLKSPKAGMHKYTLKVTSPKDEYTLENNERVAYIEVLKSKQKVLLVSNKPNWDFGFLRRSLLKNDKIKLATIVDLTGRNNFREVDEKGNYQNSQAPTRLLDHDVVIIHGDIAKLPQQVITAVAVFAQTASKGTTLFPTESLSPRTFSSGFNEILPFEFTRGISRVNGQFKPLPASGGNHPVISLKSDRTENLYVWDSFPPLSSVLSISTLKSGYKSILNAGFGESSQISLLLFVTGEKSGGRQLFIFGSGIWRWDFALKGTGDIEPHYTRLTDNIIEWLTNTGARKKLQVITDRKVYERGIPVTFIATLADGVTIEEKIKVDIYKKGDNTPLSSVELAPSTGKKNTYKKELDPPLPPDDYIYKARVTTSNGSQLSSNGAITVEKYSYEFFNPRPDTELLRNLASDSDGEYFELEDFGMNVSPLSDLPAKTTEVMKWELWNSPYPYFLLVVFLGIEWYTRKRKGML